jgi:cytochrome c peroxidase
MTTRIGVLLAVVLLLAVALGGALRSRDGRRNDAGAPGPEHMLPDTALPVAAPVAPIPRQVAVDPRKAALGRRLFHDPRLSRDNSVSCATCHDPKRGGSDGRPRAVGVAGRSSLYNAPTVLNSGLNLPSADAGGEAVHTPPEMATDWPEAVARLRQDTGLATEFRAIWGEDIAAPLVRAAIAEYLRGLLTPDAPYDRFLRGESAGLGERARAGERLFRELGCIACHQGVNLGGNMYAGLGVMADYFAERGSRSAADLGRYNLTGRPEDKHVFKVPTLRNSELTAPYFHDGSIATLEEAVRAMGRYQVGVELNDRQVGDLVAFLTSLTGRNPELAP